MRQRRSGRSPPSGKRPTTRSASYRCAISASSSMGSNVPVTLEAWVATTARVFFLMQAAASSGSSSPAGEQGAMESSTPCPSRKRRGRITELCSMDVVTTWSPGFSRPRRTQLSASVAFFVKTMESGSGAPISCATSSLASIDYARRLDGKPVAGAAGVAPYGVVELRHRLNHRGRLRPRGGRVIEIDGLHCLHISKRASIRVRICPISPCE